MPISDAVAGPAERPPALIDTDTDTGREYLAALIRLAQAELDYSAHLITGAELVAAATVADQAGKAYDDMTENLDRKAKK
jgi:hypothetical protein